MKKIFILSLVLIFAFGAFAQKDVVNANLKPNSKIIKDKQPHQAKFIELHFGEDSKYNIPWGVPIGMTNYDLQTNSAVANRMLAFDNGALSATWIQDHSDSPGGDTRGAGYAYFDGSAWQYNETTGNETIQGGRAGWPAIMTNGTEEYVVAHIVTSGNGLLGNLQTIGSSGENWSEANIEAGDDAMLWPRGVSSGDNYYAIAVDNYEGNDQTTIEGVHFFKSSNAGQDWSWGGLIPGFDTYYAYGQGDIYAIDARDSIVAIVVFQDFGDTRLWKSTDYGENWENICINDFPVDQYDKGGGVIIDEDGNSVADTLASTDQTGDVIIDSDGKVHVVFGRMRYLDEDAGDDASSYFPYTDYILYWNEDMGEGEYTGLDHDNYIDMAVPDAVDTIAWSFDLNGNHVIWEYADVAAGAWPFGTYFTSLSSFPKLGIDDNDNLYCVFTTVMEGDNYIKDDANPNAQNFRGAWIRSLRTNSGLWSDPICISDIDGFAAENVFPTIAKNVGSDVHLWLQWDNEPGLHIRGDEDPTVTDNYILYKTISVADTLNNKQVANNVEISTYPNPVNDYLTIENVDNSTIDVYNSVGQLIESVDATSNTAVIDMTSYSAGAYIIKVTSEKGVASRKVLKVK